MKTDDTVEELGAVWLPAWALPGIINGDFSGIDDNDEKMVQSWLDATLAEYNAKEIIVVPSSDYAEFRPHNAMHRQGDDCVKCALFRQD